MTIYYGKQQRGSRIGDDDESIPNTLKVGDVITLAPGSKATAEITGEAPNQTVSFGIPAGNDGSTPKITSGNVTTLSAGSKATAEIVASGVNYQVNFGIPKGDKGEAGTNATPVLMEVITSSVVTAGQKVAITFTKKYSTPPIVIPNAIWAGSQLVMGQASEITTTGCNVTVMQSVGTLLLNGSPFTSAPAKTQFSVFVTGS